MTTDWAIGGLAVVVAKVWAYEQLWGSHHSHRRHLSFVSYQYLSPPLTRGFWRDGGGGHHRHTCCHGGRRAMFGGRLLLFMVFVYCQHTAWGLFFCCPLFNTTRTAAVRRGRRITIQWLVVRSVADGTECWDNVSFNELPFYFSPSSSPFQHPNNYSVLNLYIIIRLSHSLYNVLRKTGPNRDPTQT